MIVTSFAKTELCIAITADEAVADAAHRANELRLARIVGELLPQTAHQHIDRAVIRFPIDAANVVHDPLAREDVSAIAHEQSEKPEFRGRQRERLSVQSHRAGRPVQLEAAGAHAFFARRCGSAAQDRLHARDELARLERLRQIVVRTELEPDDPSHQLAARSEHDDRHATRLADRAADCEAVDAGQHDVENDDVGRFRLHGANAVMRIDERAHREAEAREVLLEERVELFVIVDDEDAFHVIRQAALRSARRATLYAPATRRTRGRSWSRSEEHTFELQSHSFISYAVS